MNSIFGVWSWGLCIDFDSVLAYFHALHTGCDDISKNPLKWV